MRTNRHLFEKKPVIFLKKLSTLLLIFLCCHHLTGQSIIIPPSNTNGGDQKGPYGSNFGYSRSAMLYTEAELGLQTGASITEFGFFLTAFNNSNPNTPIVVRMQNTTQTFLINSTFANQIIGATTVYTGNFYLPMFSPALVFYNKPVQTPFIYTGGNLLVTVETNLGGTVEAGSSYNGGVYFRSSAGETQNWVSNNTPPFGAGFFVTTRPNMSITATPPIATIPNDACAAAKGVISFPYTFTETNGALATNNGAFTPGCPMNDGEWFRFTGNGNDIKISLTNVQSSYDPKIGVFRGSCGSLICVANADGWFEGIGETVTITNSILGQIYYVNVGQ